MTLTWWILTGLMVLGLGAGWLGALVGIGGGVLIVPALVIGFGVDFHVAVASSLLAVIATSTTAGSAYVGTGLTNMRLGMTLEIATTCGGILGGLIATLLSEQVLAGVFSGFLLLTAVLMLRGAGKQGGKKPEPGAVQAGWEEQGRLAGAYFDESEGGLVRYQARHLSLGSAISLLAGAASGMLGVGGGFLKVPAMNLGMGVPVKVAAATSNFMIGVTAAASVFFYFARGFVEPLIVAPLMLGVVLGSWAGTVTSRRAPSALVKRILVVVLLGVALQMGLRALGRGIDG